MRSPVPRRPIADRMATVGSLRSLVDKLPPARGRHPIFFTGRIVAARGECSPRHSIHPIAVCRGGPGRMAVHRVLIPIPSLYCALRGHSFLIGHEIRKTGIRRKTQRYLVERLVQRGPKSSSRLGMTAIVRTLFLGIRYKLCPDSSLRCRGQRTSLPGGTGCGMRNENKGGGARRRPRPFRHARSPRPASRQGVVAAGGGSVPAGTTRKIPQMPPSKWNDDWSRHR